MAEKDSLDMVEAFAAPAPAASQDARGAAAPAPGEARQRIAAPEELIETPRPCSPSSAQSTTSCVDAKGHVGEGRSRVGMTAIIPSPVVEVMKQPPSPFQRMGTRRLHASTDKAAMLDKMQGNLDVLRKELNDDEEAEAGSISFYGVTLLHLLVLRRGGWFWALAALALLEVFATQSVAIGTGYQKCVYDDECKLGTVCVYMRLEGMEENQYLNQAVCLDCNAAYSWPGKGAQPGWFKLASDILKPKIAGFQMAPARTGDRWDVSSNARDYCQSTLDAPFVQQWSNATNFDNCLYVQEALLKFGALDSVVMVMAFLLVCFAICAERQQQLFNQHLRLMLLPPPWRSPKAALYKFIETLLAVLLPSVTLAMALLLFGGESLSSSAILLNGVAITFVLEVDDTLPNVVLSDADKKAVDNFADTAMDRTSLTVTKHKGMANAVVSFAALFEMVTIANQGSCDQLIMGCLFTSLITPIMALVVEECVEIYHVYHAGEELIRHSKSHQVHPAGAPPPPATTKSERFVAILKKEIPILLGDCVLQALCLVIIERIALNLYFGDVVGKGGPGVLPPDML